MYGQGSYISLPGQAPHTPMLPPYSQQQQPLPGPPPPPPHFQQGPSAPPPSVGPPVYQHGRPAPPPAVRQLPPAAVPNTSQSYQHPQPTVHGSTPLPHMYSNDQHNTQLPAHLGAQNVHMPPSLLPNPPRILPPPPTMYRTPMHLQSQHPGGVQDLQRIPPPPLPPSTSGFFTSSQLGSFVQSTSGNSHVSSIAPLPPPPPPLSPPPIQPSPPPPTSPLFMSSMHHQVDSNLTIYNNPSSFKLSTSGSVPKVATTEEAGQSIPLGDRYLNEEGSLVGDSLSSRVNVTPNLPPPPPKPMEEKTVQKIEDLCELIAKNGPGYEEMIRQNESGNPEFEFLFTGDPGSEATIAHEYFLWMKKKYILASKLNEEKSDSNLRPLVPSSVQTDHLMVATRSSPSDSDMEMEDDITQSINEKAGNHSTGGTNSNNDLIHDELGVKEQLSIQQISASEKSVSLLPLEKGAGEGIIPEESSSQLIKGGSPFRLLQDYASDDEYASHLKDSSSLIATSLHRGTGSNLEMDMGIRIPSKTRKEFELRSGLTVSDKAANIPEDAAREVKETAMGSIARGTNDEHADDNHDKQAAISHAESPQAFQKRDAPGDACIEVHLNGKLQKEIEDKSAKSASNSLKIDKFGRLVREGASDSDSDEPRSNGRQSKRGRIRSRSPLERQRRSPRRRREKRSHSRSWSPRNRRSMSRSPRSRRSRSRSPRNRRSRSRSPRRQRSRSRSPAFKHVRDFGGVSMRRNRSQVPECFDFRRGRCFRGASCRYLHDDSEKGDGSKRRRSKQQHFEVPHIRENSNIHEDIKHSITKVFDEEHNEVEISEMQHQNVPSSASVAIKYGNAHQKKEDSICDATRSGNFHQDDQLIDCQTVKSGSSREPAAKVLGTGGVGGDKDIPITLSNKICHRATESRRPMLVGGFATHRVRDVDTLKSQGDAYQKVHSASTSLIKQSLSILSDPVLQNVDCPPLRTDNSSLSDSAPEQTSITSVNEIPVTKGLPKRRHSPQLAPPPPLSQGLTTQPVTQPLWDHDLTSKDAAFPLQSTSGERFPSYMLPRQQSHFTVSSVASWTSLPPPPPGVSSQLQQSHLAPRFISRPYTAELPTHSEVGGFQQRAYPLEEPHQSLLNADDFRRPLPLHYSQSQQFVGPSLSSSHSQGDNQSLPTAFSWELSVNRMQHFPGDNLPSGELLKSSSRVHPYLQEQQPPNGLHQSVGVSSSKYPPDLRETNQSPPLPDFIGSMNSTYCNPYASSAEQPVSSKFSSEALRQEDTSHGSPYAAPFSLSNAQIYGQNIGSVGSRQATLAVGQNFPRSGGDQYDPLLDSLEPSMNLSKKFSNAEKCEPSSDSDIMLRHSGSNKPLDVEENNKKKEVGGVALATFEDDEEYGETADAEVGAVENGSPSNPTYAANIATGEIEIDQIKSPGKSKKNKESRSVKLFKVALADFVKEVLKPSWRQGNMSKEAFKTIVKKTVDKVSGAMKSHQIPKSRAKIDQYIDSQQRKLTKLVTGYVDKYVKM